jgi:hypothetical protein
MEIGEEKASESGNPQFRGQFWNQFNALFSDSENFPRSHTCVCIGCGYNKNRRHYKNWEGLTNDIQYMVMRRTKTMNTDLNSRVRYLKIPWANPNSNEYTKAIEVINDCYRKMLMIGKSKEVFWLPNDKVPDLLSAKPYREFILAKNNIEQHSDRFLKLGAVKLNIRIPTELVPNPKNYTEKASLPMQWSILVREEILNHEFHMKNLNVSKCELCLELHIVDREVQQTRKPYSCYKCHDRKDPIYFLKNNLHPVCYEVLYDGEFIRDKDGNRVPHF